MTDEDSIIQEYLEKGVLIPHWDENEQDFMYSVDVVRAQEHAPEFYASLMEELDETLLSLYSAGYVDMEYNENLEPLFGLTEKGRKYVEQEIINE